MTINEYVKEIHTLAKEKGWWENPRNPLELHMLMVSELAEATEEARKDMPPMYLFPYADDTSSTFEDDVKNGSKPEGELIELADCVIRIMDYVGSKGWDLEKAIELKHNYNKTRAYRHGGKKF